ncbi:MAG: hypothetical protein QM726_04825 [Chitinophagaceae bacterium]
MKMRHSGYVAIMVLLVNFFASCENAVSNSSLSKDEKKQSPKEKLDSLEKMFGSDNWLAVDGKDSSYFYFSRLSANNFKTYSYRMLKGDSTASVVTEITISGDSILWKLPGKDKQLLLKQVTGNEAVWNEINTVNSYSFSKIDSSKLLMKYSAGNSIELVKTITLSAFLVRSKYDYKNGTHLAFDNSK